MEIANGFVYSAGKIEKLLISNVWNERNNQVLWNYQNSLMSETWIKIVCDKRASVINVSLPKRVMIVSTKVDLDFRLFSEKDVLIVQMSRSWNVKSFKFFNQTSKMISAVWLTRVRWKKGFSIRLFLARLFCLGSMSILKR